MHPAQQPVLNPSEVTRILLAHPRRWIVPAVVVGVAALLYAAVRPSTWEASQALIVRNEVANGQEGLGKFTRADEMKTVQETILELARSRGVLAAALQDVGPPADYRRGKSAWPSEQQIDELRKQVKLTPPKGAEFGKTEVFYLKVRSHERARAVALATSLVEELQTRFQRLLDDRAASVINELEHAVALAETDLEASAGRLRQLETEVGSDLAELRILNESPAGGSDLREKVVEVETELRAAKDNLRAKTELRSLLQAASSDPSQLEALPSRLLESHATLRRLTEGLSTARLQTSSLLGKMTDAHPLVQAGKIEQRAVVDDLSRELSNAIQIADVELRLAGARVESLEEQLADVRARFDHLAALRTPYANLVAETRNRTDLLQTARRTLADARASQAAAQTASLIAQIDRPDTGTNPVGLSRAMTVLVGLFGGLLAGLGVVCLTVQPGLPTAKPTPPKHPVETIAPVRPNGRPLRPARQPMANLTVRQALERIAAASTA